MSKVQLPNTKLFINNEWVESVSGKKLKTFNPTNGKLICEVSEGGKEDVDVAVKAARNALDNGPWGKMTAEDRGKLILKLADLVDQHREHLSDLETLDNGKPLTASSGFDITEAARALRYFGGWADKIQGKTIPISSEFTAMTKHEPIGVVGLIVAWNFPLLLLSWKLGPSLAAGCTIVAKPSEFTPLTALYFCELVKEAGFPPGVINIVNGVGDVVGDALSHHMDVDKISFTGSTRVGRLIMEAAAKSNLKPVTLELGGKSPNIIFGDCDIEYVANAAKNYVFANSMQLCCAASRFFVHESILDAFLTIFTEKIKQLKVGDPYDSETHLGPLVSKQQHDRVLGYIQKGKEEGATCHLGGEVHNHHADGAGYFIQPTIFTNVTDDMTICKEEIFGPVVVILPFKTVDEVIKRANDTTYGLAAGVWTKDISLALNVSNKLKSGSVWVNGFNILKSQIPFGGFKQSGFGRDLSEYAIQGYLSVKAVTIAHKTLHAQQQ
ncbi:aldehyde dehydrogenase [Dictyostelium discoideum AX4]|uniref:Aldehyde dehydrogenase n=1 Tax=Dictyostelium discoideum TaxID=44689 RepID=Q54FY2_DICDI|nr:aldehyde dehydrogenase [Dictyostelium discoideum AX4]EAL62128.1 aldehyde dehydrogenase [Dictyostelium discoideum AX4]|eukprot:XP_635635.1 aldehyde dehydrogenase [Dictyostelium discoideum AX4]